MGVRDATCGTEGAHQSSASDGVFRASILLPATYLHCGGNRDAYVSTEGDLGFLFLGEKGRKLRHTIELTSPQNVYS